jgi:hypothetical protein
MGVTFSASKNDGASTSSHGASFLDLLAILFIGLKLTGYIGWSWAAVLSPIWVPWAIIVVLDAVAGTIAMIAEWMKR